MYGANNEYYRSPDGQEKDIEFAQSKGDQNILFENKDGFLQFNDNSGGLDYLGTSRSAVYFDFDNDGDQDIMTNEYHGSAKLFKNTAADRNANWVKIIVKSKEKSTCSDAIGTLIELTTPDGTVQWKEVHSTTGYLSGHPKIQHFGLGNHQYFRLKVTWPNGKKENFQFEKVNSSITLSQENK